MKITEIDNKIKKVFPHFNIGREKKPDKLYVDEVRKVYTGWDMSAAKPESESSQSGVSAAMVHGIEQMIGEVKIFKNGNFEMVKPLEEIKVDYPDIGKRST